jgi:transposase
MYRLDLYYRVKTLLEKGYIQRKIARELGIHRKTVKKILTELGKDRYAPRPIQNEKRLEAHQDQIQQRFDEGMSMKLIYQWLINNHQFNVSYPTVARYVQEFKTSEVYMPLAYDLGDEAQIDFRFMGRFLKMGRWSKYGVLP